MLLALFLTVHIIVSIFLILVVLLQTGKGGDIASAFGGGGGSQAFLGPRGASNVLTKATTISAIAFMITCLALVMLYGRQADSALSAVDSAPVAVEETVPATTDEAPAAATTEEAAETSSEAAENSAEDVPTEGN